MQECAKMAPCWASSPNIKCNYINTNPNSTAPILQQLTHEAINHLELLSILGDVENWETLQINTFTLSTCICICSVGKPLVSKKNLHAKPRWILGFVTHTHQKTKSSHLPGDRKKKNPKGNSSVLQTHCFRWLSSLFVVIKGSGR